MALKFLLDTHVLLWWLADDPLLSKKARSYISEKTNLIYVSAATTWEISIKKSLGKLDSPDNIIEMIKDNEFIELPITVQHSVAIKNLEKHHQDPFDRLLIVQAKREMLTLLTSDEKIFCYSVPYLKV